MALFCFTVSVKPKAVCSVNASSFVFGYRFFAIGCESNVDFCTANRYLFLSKTAYIIF